MRKFGVKSFGKGGATQGEGIEDQTINPANTKYIQKMRSAFLNGEFSNLVYNEMGMSEQDAINDRKRTWKVLGNRGR